MDFKPIGGPDIPLGIRTPKFSEIAEKTVAAEKNEPGWDIYDNYNPISIPSRANKVTAFIGGDEVYKGIEDTIRSAEKSILLEMYDFSDFELAEILVAQKNSGVDIKVLLDQSNIEGNTTSDARAAVVHHLRQNKIPVLTFQNDRLKNQSDHCKLAVVDGKSVLLGGMNWNPNSKNNHDAMVKIEGPAAGYYNLHFAEGWNVSGGGRITTEPAPSPEKKTGRALVKGIRSDGKFDTSAKHSILESINSAQSSIYIEMYRLSDKNVIEGLITAHNDGIDVRVILDPNSAKTGWSVNDKTFDTLKKAGVPVRWYKVEKNSTQRLHAKWAVIDEESTIIGSVNWSAKGLHENREVGAHINESKTANVFVKQFLDDWENKSSEKYTM